MPTVLIADDNRSWAESLQEMINRQEGFEVVALAHTGQDTLNLIDSHRPDIIILDIVMPEYDGAFITKHVRTEIPGYYPVLYILSGIGTDSMIHMLSELDIDFYSMKPVSINVVMDNLHTIAYSAGKGNLVHFPTLVDNTSPASGTSPAEKIRSVIIQLGLTPSRPSTLFVTDALSLCLDNPDNYGLLTKVLYPEIAKKHSTTAAAVERNIRSAIAQMKKKDTKLYQRIFAYTTPGKITNSEFLFLVCDYIRNL